MIILISYDLNGHERPEAYDDVKKAITENAIAFKKPLYSQWLVETDKPVEWWHQIMKSVADDNDNWLIIKIQKPYTGWLPKSIWTWLRERI